MLFSVLAVSCLIVVQGVPLGYEMEPGLDMGMDMIDDVVEPGLGMSMGRGVGRVGGIRRSGSQYGRRRNEGGASDYDSHGYETEGGSRSHDIGHLDKNFKQYTESHVSEGHDSGHSSGHSSRGHERGGHRSYGAEEDGYGGRYYSGIGI